MILFCHNGVNFIITAPCPKFQDEDGKCIGKQISSLAMIYYLIKCVSLMRLYYADRYVPW